MRIARAKVETMDQLDQWLSSTRKFRLDFLREDADTKAKSMESLYNHLIFDKCPTYFIRGSSHCEAGRGRSLNDLIIVYKYYNPEKSYKEIYKELIKFYISQMEKREFFLDLAYCPDIRRYNFRIARYLRGDINILRKCLKYVKADIVLLYPNLDTMAVFDFINELTTLWQEE